MWTGDFCSARDANALILTFCPMVYSFFGKYKVITTKTSLQLAERIDAGPRDGGDIAEADAFPKQTDFLLVLVLVGIVAFTVGRWSAHLDTLPAALGDVLVTTARHTLLDSQPLHRRYLEENCADE